MRALGVDDRDMTISSEAATEPGWQAQAIRTRGVARAVVGEGAGRGEGGRYRGILGASWGVGRVLGPLIGGFFVDNLSWRGVFYTTLPIGVAALAVTASVLPSRLSKARHVID